MKQIILSLILIFSTILFGYTQEKIKGDKNVTTIETEVNAFNKIIIGEDFEVSLIEGNNASVEIETDENLHDVIQFMVVDDVLKFHTTKKITSSKKMDITIRYTKNLRAIEVIDDAEVNSLTSINNDTIAVKVRDYGKVNLNVKSQSFRFSNNNKARLKLSSKSRLNINSSFVDFELKETSKTEALITADSLSIRMLGKADAQIEGSVKSLNASLVNSNNFEGKNLDVEKCMVTLAENSDFEIQVIDTITIDASGNSEIYLYGNPAITINRLVDKVKLYKKEL